MERVPRGLARDRLEDVRVDLRQRVVARDAPERVRQPRIDACVVQCVAGLVHERLVVGEAALRTRNEMHDLRRVGGDDARARILLRPVLEIEPDVRDRIHVEAERLDARETHVDGALLRVRRLERREAAKIVHVRVRRQRVALGAEQLVEPALAQTPVRVAGGIRGLDQDALELAQRDRLLLLVARDRVRLARELRLELLGRGEQREPLRVEAGRLGALELPQRLAVSVGVQHRQSRLCRAERHLLALEGHTSAEDRVLERVLLLGELSGHETGLARLAQPVQPLALLPRRHLLGLAQRLDLRAREEIPVAADDGGLLRDLFLTDPDGASLLGALEVVLLEPGLVVGRRTNRGCGHSGQPNALDRRSRGGARPPGAPRS